MEMPCIHCGDCARACPVGLQPQRLLQALSAQRPGEAQALGLPDCSECGRCDFACPSRIALRARFAVAKQEARERDALLRQAQAARARFEARGHRLQLESEERRERESAAATQATSADAVAAAIARAQAKRRPPADPT
jgi:electron transport complex protein RnfC